MPTTSVIISKAENGYVVYEQHGGDETRGHVFQSLKPAMSKAEAILEPKGEPAPPQASQTPASE